MAVTHRNGSVLIVMKVEIWVFDIPKIARFPCDCVKILKLRCWKSGAAKAAVSCPAVGMAGVHQSEKASFLLFYCKLIWLTRKKLWPSCPLGGLAAVASACPGGRGHRLLENCFDKSVQLTLQRCGTT